MDHTKLNLVTGIPQSCPILTEIKINFITLPIHRLRPIEFRLTYFILVRPKPSYPEVAGVFLPTANRKISPCKVGKTKKKGNFHHLMTYE